MSLTLENHNQQRQKLWKVSKEIVALLAEKQLTNSEAKDTLNFVKVQLGMSRFIPSEDYQIPTSY